MHSNVFITGSSSGIGKATVELFAQRGWQVAATMRTLDPDLFKIYPLVKKYQLDVSDPQECETVLKKVKHDFGNIDVVINNAGYGVTGIFEAMDDNTIVQQFETNVFGLMRLTRLAISLMRKQKKGIIIQVASMGGRLAFPLYSVYHATKWAVEGFTESLQFELEPLGIRVKLIEPGVIKTNFYTDSRFLIKPTTTSSYDAFLHQADKRAQTSGSRGSDPKIVAEAIWQAATDGSGKLRYPVAAPAPLLLFSRRMMPDWVYRGLIKMSFGL